MSLNVLKTKRIIAIISAVADGNPMEKKKIACVWIHTCRGRMLMGLAAITSIPPAPTGLAAIHPIASIPSPAHGTSSHCLHASSSSIQLVPGCPWDEKPSTPSQQLLMELHGATQIVQHLLPLSISLTRSQCCFVSQAPPSSSWPSSLPLTVKTQ